MLRITIELVPHGDEDFARIIAQGRIWNDATGTKTRGNYEYELGLVGKELRRWRRGQVKRFPRRQLNAWNLLELCLLAAERQHGFTPKSKPTT